MSDRRRATGLFLALLALYLATGSGLFHSDDEMSVWAVAASLAGQGAVTIDQIAWNQDLGGGVGRAMADGTVYGKYGIGGSLLIVPLLLVGDAVPGTGLVQIAMLLNAPLTALAGALIFGIGRRLGATPAAATILSLLYGVATLAWVYARYLFGEPIVATAWLLAFWLLLRAPPRDRDVLLAGAAIGFAVLVRTASVAAVPGFLVLLWCGDRRLRQAAVLMMPVVIGLGVVGAYNALRFGSPFDSGYNPIESFAAPWGQGIAGLIWGPGRGLIWYAPPVLLALAGAWPFVRRWRLPALAAGWIGLSTLFLFAKWHAWHGGWNWGPRLILPALPFLLLFALPVIQDRRWRPVVALLGIAGAAVTLLGVVVDFNVLLLEMLARYPDFGPGALFFTLDDWAASPIPNHARLLLASQPDLFWWTSSGINLPLAVTAAAGVAAGIMVLWRRVPLQVGVVGCLGLAVALTRSAGAIDRLSGGDQRIALVVEQVRDQPRPSVIVNAVGHANALLNRLPLRSRMVQILPEGTPIQPIAEQRLARGAASDFWLIQVGAPPVGDDNGIESRLDTLAYKADTLRTGDVRLTGYLAGTPSTLTPTQITFGDRLRLDAVAVALPAEGVRIDLVWIALRSPGARFVESIRLRGPESVVLQVDREPTDGARPTDDWQAGERIAERLALPVRLAAGEYTVEMVVYLAGGGRPLATATGDVVTIAQFRVP